MLQNKSSDEQNCSRSEKKKPKPVLRFMAGAQLLPSKAHRPHVCSQLLGVLNCSQTAEVSKPADELQRSSSQVKCSSRTHTYTEESSRRSCVRRTAKIKKLPLFFSFPPSTHLPFKDPWYPWNVLPLERLGRNQEWTPCSLSFPPPPHLKRLLFLFSWGWHAQPSVQLPPASREAANLSPHPPRPQQMSLGGHRLGRGQNRQEAEGEKATVALVVIIFWLTHDKLCEELVCQVQVFQREKKK